MLQFAADEMWSDADVLIRSDDVFIPSGSIHEDFRECSHRRYSFHTWKPYEYQDDSLADDINDEFCN